MTSLFQELSPLLSPGVLECKWRDWGVNNAKKKKKRINKVSNPSS
jgi:hypothetical protein